MKRPVGGMIAYFNLQDWWVSAFTDHERTRIVSAYGDRLIQGNVSATSHTERSLLKAMANFWNPTPEDERIAAKILDRMETINE